MSINILSHTHNTHTHTITYKPTHIYYMTGMRTLELGSGKLLGTITGCVHVQKCEGSVKLLALEHSLSSGVFGILVLPKLKQKSDTIVVSSLYQRMKCLIFNASLRLLLPIPIPTQRPLPPNLLPLHSSIDPHWNNAPSSLILTFELQPSLILT